MTKWRMRFACWIPKAADTHSKYVVLLLHGNNGYTDVPQFEQILQYMLVSERIFAQCEVTTRRHWEICLYLAVDCNK